MNEKERREAEALMNQLDDETLARIDELMSDEALARHKPRSSWEVSLDPRASWQHSARGLLPGTVFAILLVLAALVLYLYVSPVVGVIVGILAVLNGIVAANHWVRLLGQR